MSIETDAVATEDRSVEDIATALGEAITDLPEYREFVAAKEAVEADETAQERIREFERIRQEYVHARETGQATEEHLRTLQSAQEDLHDVPVMAEFLQAQSELEIRLQAVNEHVSDPLAIDFGEKAGGCCQD